MIELINDPRIFISIKEFFNGAESEHLIAAHTIRSVLVGNKNLPMYHLVDSIENADIVIQGESRSTSVKPNLEDLAGSSFLSCNVEIDVSIKIGDITKCTLNSVNTDVCLPQNINEVTKSSAKKIAKKLITKILLCTEPTIRLVVRNLAPDYYITFPDHIREIWDVQNVFSRRYKDLTGIYSVNISGTIDNFILNLQNLATNIKLIAASNSQIEIEIR